MKKIIKNIICIFISGALVFTGTTVFADKTVGKYTYKYFTYNINSDNTITLISCDPSVTNALIPTKINNMHVVAVNGSTFQDCSSLKKITVSSDNEYFSVSSEGILMSKDKSKFIKCPPLLDISSYNISSDVTIIAPYCFENSDTLQYVTIPENVSTIGKCAFNGTSFTNITISNPSVYISSEALGYSGSEKTEDFTIYGHENSTAQKYAEDNGFSFIPFGNDSFDVSINGNLYFYNDDKSFSSENIIIKNKSGNTLQYSFSSTPSDVFQTNKSNLTQIKLLSSDNSIITYVNVRVAMAGDSNMDGKITVADAAAVARKLAGRKSFTLFENMCADKNKDGKTTVADAAAIARGLAAKKR